jgi:uncharacterized protein
VRTPDGGIRIDPTGRLNGRGAYVDRDPACLEAALERGLLARALETSIPAELAGELLAAAAHTPTTVGGDANGAQ